MDFVRLIKATAPFGLACLLASSALAQDASWHSYSDAARGFSISYPDGWKVDPQFADKGYAFTQGDADDVRYGVGLSPTVDLAPGTDLESRQLVVAIQTARPGDTCRAKSFLADASPDYFTRTLQDTPDTTFTEAEPGDLFTVEHLVHMVSRTPCIAVQVYLVYRRAQPHDPKPAPHFDRKALFAAIDRIVATLRPLK